MEYPWEKDENYDETTFEEEGEVDWEKDNINRTFDESEAGMLAMYDYLKTEGQKDFVGWDDLWNNYDDYMTTEFRMLVALRILSVCSDVSALFPYLRPWIRSIDVKDVYVRKNERPMKLRELIARTFKSGELVRSMFANNAVNREVLRLAAGIMNLCQDWVETEKDQDNVLLAVYWTKTLYSSGHIQIEPTVDFIRKSNLIKKFTTIKEFDDILEQGIHKLEEIKDSEICSLIRAGTRCITPIFMNTKKKIMMLDAEVPRVLDDRAGYVVKNYLLACLGQKAESSRFEISHDQELLGDALCDVFRIVLINKLNFYKALKEIWTAMGK